MNSPDDPTRIHVPVSFQDGAEADLAARASAAVTSARTAQQRWAVKTTTERLRLFKRLRQLIAEEAIPLATASCHARWRPIAESMIAEVVPLAEACRFLEREAAALLAPRRLSSWTRPLWLTGVATEIRREPHGIVLIIGPGNYPLLLPGVQILQALAAGNAVLVKPAVHRGEPIRYLLDLLVSAGFDPALTTLLPDSTEAAQAVLAANIDKVLFTGSAATGEKILSQLAPRLVPATMELSGCDAVIVRADADLHLVVKALTFGLTLNNGATCMAPKRVLVHRSISKELEGRLANSFPRGSRGNEARPSRQRDQNFLTSAATSQLRPILEDAIAQGAHFISGNMAKDGTIQTPVILGGVAYLARLLREDVFAPVLAIITVSDDVEAVSCANDCPHALGASIFTRDESAARFLAAKLNAGVVTINDLIIPTADARIPFGGRKRSGFGVTRGAEGLLELTTPKVVTLSRSKFRPAFDPPHPKDETMFQAYLEITHGRGWKARWQSMLKLARAAACRARGGVE